MSIKEVVLILVIVVYIPMLAYSMNVLKELKNKKVISSSTSTLLTVIAFLVPLIGFIAILYLKSRKKSIVH